jgi:hypothetical protein
MNNKEPVIIYGVGCYSIGDGQDVTHNITSIIVDRFDSTVTVVIEKGIEVSQVKLTMEVAQEIGFINVRALKQFCK